MQHIIDETITNYSMPFFNIPGEALNTVSFQELGVLKGQLFSSCIEEPDQNPWVRFDIHSKQDLENQITKWRVIHIITDFDRWMLVKQDVCLRIVVTEKEDYQKIGLLMTYQDRDTLMDAFRYIVFGTLPKLPSCAIITAIQYPKSGRAYPFVETVT